MGSGTFLPVSPEVGLMAGPQRRYSLDEYFAMEASSAIRHESRTAI
jgi:hypothetical protein